MIASPRAVRQDGVCPGKCVGSVAKLTKLDTACHHGNK
jgi:hypothetical protein